MKAEEQNPESVVSWLSDLKKHPGYKLLENRYEEIVEKTKAGILDTETSDQDTHDLKQKLSMLERVKPSDVISKMESKAQKGITAYKKSTQGTS